MKTQQELLSAARHQSEKLIQDLVFESGGMGGSHWWAKPRTLEPAIAAASISALEFLRRFAGASSSWTQQAQATIDSTSGTVGDKAQTLAGLLASWADNVDLGLAGIAGESEMSARRIVSTDVMQQVRLLLETKDIHPAAPIVLAGAALETALREAVEQKGLEVKGARGIGSYAGALRSANVLGKQDVKDVEQMSGLRNAAAHGDFAQLSLERAGLMEQQVNLFLARLETLLDA